MLKPRLALVSVSAAKVTTIALMEEVAFQVALEQVTVTVHATVTRIATMDKDAMSVRQLGQQQPVLTRIHIAGVLTAT